MCQVDMWETHASCKHFSTLHIETGFIESFFGSDNLRIWLKVNTELVFEQLTPHKRVTCVTCVTDAGIARYCHLCCLDSKAMRPGKLRRWCLWLELWIWIPIVGRWTEPQKIYVDIVRHPCDNCLTGLTRLSHWRRQCQPCPVQGVSHWNLGSNSRSRWSMVVLVQIWEEKMRKIIKS